MTLVIAILMGFLIFPAVTSFGLQNQELGGTTLVFVTLPEVFVGLPCTRLWSTMFFLLLFMGALTSIVSIAEVSVAFVIEHFNKTRKQAVWIVLAPIFALSAVCSLSFSTLSDIVIFGENIFGFLDMLTNNFMLPIVAFFGCVYMGWFSPKGLMKRQLTNDGQLKDGPLYDVVIFIVRWLAPVAILAIFVSNII
jgi:NSS family neurotransmitter:Na+ symporter